MKIRHIIITLVFFIAFSSCIKDVDYKLEFEGSKLVVIANGQANKQLVAYITQTFEPMTEANPDSLIINNALIEVFENDILVDTMVLIENGMYQSKIKLKENLKYYISVISKGFNKVISAPDTVSIPAKLLDVEILKISPEKNIHKSYKLFFDFKFTVQKSVLFPYNNLTIKYFSKGSVYEDYLILSSGSDFIECDDCFNLLDNPCTINKGNNIYEINTHTTLYSPEFLIDELDSVQFVLETYTSLIDKLCQVGIDLEEYYNNPLPFVSNPSVDFTNIEGGYGLFMLSSVDSLTVRLK